MNSLARQPEGRVLVTGATGFIGRRLIEALVARNVKLRLLVRAPGKVPRHISRRKGVEVVKGDLLHQQGLQEALAETDCAFYLVHSLGAGRDPVSRDFEQADRLAAGNFLAAAEQAELKRIIYLGGLGATGGKLSPHLESRAEVADILSSGKPAATILRAAVIIGAGGASFEMLRYLVERLPIFILPEGVESRVQPIAVDDVIAYLVGCLENAGTAGQDFDIGGPEILTYRKMLEQYAVARGLADRFMFEMPLLPAKLTGFFADLVTPVPASVSRPLLEGLTSEVVCRNNRIDEFVSIRKTSFDQAVRIAFAEERTGPGVTGF